MIAWQNRLMSSEVSGLVPCSLCSLEPAAAGSRWCQFCEHQMLTASIDRAALANGEPMGYKRRETNQDKFWRLFVAFAAAVVTLAALWECLVW